MKKDRNYLKKIRESIEDPMDFICDFNLFLTWKPFNEIFVAGDVKK